MISVLYIDDEESFLVLTKRFLETKGDFIVDTAKSAEIGLEKLKTTPYDVVVSDYKMPGMDGIELLSLLRHEYPDLPVIIFTGKGREEVVIEAFDNGADFYVQKGGDIIPQYTELMHKIQSAVSLRHEEKELRDSEERFRLSFDLASIGKSLTGIDGTLARINRAFCEMLGYSEDELRKKGFADITYPDDLAESRECVRSLLAGERPMCRFEKRYIRKDGTILWTDVSTILLRDTTGKPRFFITDILDITERKRGEQALRESEIRFRDLFNNMITGVAIYESASNGRDFIIRDINRAVETIEHIRKEEVIGKSVLTIFPGVKDIGLFDVFQRVAQTGIAESHPVSLYRDNRISGWRKNFVYKLHSGEIVAIYEDVTEKKQAEDAMRGAQHWLGMALRAAHAGIWDWDLPTGILTWSPEFFELFGLPPDATPSFNTWLATLHPDDREQAMATINQSIKDHSPLWNEYRIVLPEDGVRWIGSGGNTTYNDAGEPLHMSGICIDITDRKGAEEALRQANKKLNLLGSITRHDILNEVAILDGYLDLAGREPLDPALQRYFDKLSEAVKTIRHQIEFTREYQEIGVKDATWQNIRNTVEKAGSAFRTEQVTLTINCGNYQIFADPLLQKVFYNLFDNAFRYAPPFKAISVTCTETDSGLDIVFADDGKGITDDVREHLFEHGYGKHTGLGLFLSREILAITGISITENGEPGKGARFVITVPNGKFRSISE